MHNCNKKHKAHGYTAPHHQGPIRRVTRALADKMGVPRKLVLAAFIIGIFVNLFLTAIVFFLSLYWVNHPDRVEQKISRVAQKVKGWTKGPTPSSYQNQYAYAGSQTSHDTHQEQEVDLDFADLCRDFEDLERRTAGMEKHVSSEEYKLNKEFEKMQGDDKSAS